MKLIEVVVLMGAHCVSPVQHTGNATEAAKVQCAVVIEKDTEAGTLRIIPAGASRKPEVVAVLDRLEGNAETIEPAAAPPVPQAAAPVIALPPPLAEAAPETPAAAQEPQTEPVKAEKPKETRKAAEKARPAPSQEPKQAEKQASKSKCLGEAKPKWYTNAEGRRKYRCVLPG